MHLRTPRLVEGGQQDLQNTPPHFRQWWRRRPVPEVTKESTMSTRCVNVKSVCEFRQSELRGDCGAADAPTSTNTKGNKDGQPTLSLNSVAHFMHLGSFESAI